MSVIVIVIRKIVVGPHPRMGVQHVSPGSQDPGCTADKNIRPLKGVGANRYAGKPWPEVSCIRLSGSFALPTLREMRVKARTEPRAPIDLMEH